MTTEEFVTYQEETFDAYCKWLIQNEGKNARRELSRHEKKEVVFSALPETVVAGLSYTDSYGAGSETFQIDEDTVTIKDAALAKALATLPENWLDVVLLFYFLGKTDRQIGADLHLTPDAVYYRRKHSLGKLKKALRELDSDTKR